MSEPTPTHIPTNDALKAGLRAWAETNGIRPAQFGRDMGYLDPSYGWALLRGKAVVTTECLGRFVIAYGGLAAEILLELAGNPNDADQRAVSAETDVAGG